MRTHKVIVLEAVQQDDGRFNQLATVNEDSTSYLSLPCALALQDHDKVASKVTQRPKPEHANPQEF